MKIAPFTPRGHLSRAAVGEAVAQSFMLAVACLVSYEITTQASAHIPMLSDTNDLLGGLWAVIATIFVYRLSHEDSMTAAVSRMAATLVSFVLCLGYLLLLPFSVWGMATLIGAGALVVTLLGRPKDAVTTGITTTVVMVAAALDPADAWKQPILRLADTAIGTLVGLVAAWISPNVLHIACALAQRTRRMMTRTESTFETGGDGEDRASIVRVN